MTAGFRRRRRSTTSARARTAASAAAGLLVLAGCADPAGQADLTSPVASTAPAEPAVGEPVLRVAVIGDSIAYGRSDCGGCTPFVDRYATALAERTGRTVTADNLSTHDDLTTPQLVTRIRSDEYFRTAVAAADILVVSIGHHDTPWAITTDSCDGANGASPPWEQYREPCMTHAAHQQAEQLKLFLAEARRLRAGQPTVQIVTTPYNDWIGRPGASESATRPTALTLDAFEAADCAAAAGAGARCVDSYHAFNGPAGRSAAGDLLAADHTHPSARGHELFARLLGSVDVSSVTAR